ncbi:TPA: hypothetical protein SAN82_003925 [Pseudomonas putida]|nr:hypothetical protein [Pseudomonas putida]
MIIRANEWTAHLAATAKDPYFRVHGFITVGNYAYGAVLSRRWRQNSFQELDLDLEPKVEYENGQIIKANAEIQHHLPVEYKINGTYSYTGVNIYVEGSLFHHISRVVITY